jgi:hypothetical protein
MASEERRTHWIEAGDAAFLCVMADQIVAVVYWQGPQSAEIGGEQMNVPGDWHVVHASDPDNHFALGVEERDGLHEALNQGGRHVIARLDRLIDGGD